ncbi:MAG TPA: DNA-3-methyladenine glycosylase [Trebonia sp.]|nr:DNA-3-methyladenine glycosylase [Trebonia sp.]
MGSPLVPRDFFNRPAEQVAPELLGRVLEHETADGLVAVEITEVEAYAGESDPASHAWRGRTARTAVMYGPPGHAYVYFTYGMHFCVNLVCLPAGTANAVLLRAGRVIAGEEIARTRRTARPRVPGVPAAVMPATAVSPSAVPPPARPARDLARGPARLCRALDIDRSLDGVDVCDSASPVRLRAGSGAAGGTVRSGPRVGISRAAEIPWRFWLDGDPTVSPFRPYVPRRR